MRLKRLLATALFLAVLAFLWVQLFSLFRQSGELKKTEAELRQKHEALVRENERLEREVTYYSYPENIEKLLRSRFNYKKPGEHMIIVIPSE
jgi:cell division protein FtsB